MVLNLYLLRHGETEYNLKRGIIGGQSNHLALSERGVKQAQALGERLKREGLQFDAFYSSTAKRAIDTAAIVAEVIGYQRAIPAFTDLLELSQGQWEGKLRSEFYTPEVLESMKRLSWDFKAPEGESQKDVEQRAYDWVERTLLKGEDQNLTIGIFSHGQTTKCLLRRVLDSNPSFTYKIEIDNCSITHLRHSREGQHKGWGLVKVNDNAHIRDLGFVDTSYT